MQGRDASAGPASMPPLQGFSFTNSMRLFCADAIGRLSPLAHIDLGHVAVSFAQARKRTRHGLYASLTPMRFEGGSLTCRRQARTYTIQRLYDTQGR